MEKYRRKEVGLDQEPPLQPNEIRMSQNGKPKQYVQQVVDLLLDQTHPRVTITGLGATINKAVTVAEITKRRITQELKLGPLRQETDIENIKATDMWESVDGDLDALKVTRNLPSIRIILQLESPPTKTEPHASANVT